MKMKMHPKKKKPKYKSVDKADEAKEDDVSLDCHKY